MANGYMQIMIGSHPTYEDGDIVGACNHLTIRRSAAYRICAARTQGRKFAVNGHGFMPTTHVLRDWCEATMELKLERLSRDECRITRLSDSESIAVTTGTPFTDLRGKPGRQMDVDLYFRGQIAAWNKHHSKPLFSDDGNTLTLVTYGGRTKADGAAMDAVWSAIESKTAFTEATEAVATKEHPFGGRKKKHLYLKVDDFTDAEGAQLTEPLLDAADPPNMVKKRKRYIGWRTNLALSAPVIAQIESGAVWDLTALSFQRVNIVDEKSV